jgi:steroid delta-isomerase-like uncharacterized protein
MRAFFPAVAATSMVWAMSGCGTAQRAPQVPVSTQAPTPAVAQPLPQPASSASVDPTPTPGVAQTADGDAAGDVLGAMRDAFNAHDADKLASSFTEDCTVESYDGPAAHGREELVAALRRTFDAFSDVKAAPLRGWVTGNVIVSELAWSGTMTGGFMGLKASHKPVGLVTVRVLHLADDGRVKTMTEYGDAAALVDQMTGKKGAPPPPVLPSNTLDLHVAKGTPDEDRLGAWAKGFDEAFDSGSPQTALAAISSDGDYWTNVGGPPLAGRTALEKGLSAWFKAFPDQKWKSTEAWGVDGFAIIEHTMSGTQKGAFGAHPASKKTVTDWRWIDILQPAADGTVLHGWGFTNVMEMLQQTGAIKRPGDTTNVAPAAKPTTGAAPAPKKQ